MATNGVGGRSSTSTSLHAAQIMAAMIPRSPRAHSSGDAKFFAGRTASDPVRFPLRASPRESDDVVDLLTLQERASAPVYGPALEG